MAIINSRNFYFAHKFGVVQFTGLTSDGVNFILDQERSIISVMEPEPEMLTGTKRKSFLGASWTPLSFSIFSPAIYTRPEGALSHWALLQKGNVPAEILGYSFVRSMRHNQAALERVKLAAQVGDMLGQIQLKLNEIDQIDAFDNMSLGDAMAEISGRLWDLE